MDRALQERVIGAIVLVVMAVLIVPVFLDGPADDAQIVSQGVTLPGQNSQPVATQKIVLNRDRSEPVPANSPPRTAVTETVAEPLPPETTPPAASTADAVATQVSSTGMWAVQLGSFSRKDNAEQLAADLRKKGFAAFLSQLDTGSTSLHRVRVGPQKDRQSAESVAAQLQKSGHSGQVVPHP